MYNCVCKPLPKGAKVILKELKSISSIKEISKKTGYKINTVYFYICKYFPFKEKKDRKTKIINQLKQGKKQSKIAKENNVSRQYVNKIKKVMEIKNG
jgi:DNA-binding CsgD family transcriptional regulator